MSDELLSSPQAARYLGMAPSGVRAAKMRGQLVPDGLIVSGSSGRPAAGYSRATLDAWRERTRAKAEARSGATLLDTRPPDTWTVPELMAKLEITEYRIYNAAHAGDLELVGRLPGPTPSSPPFNLYSGASVRTWSASLQDRWEAEEKAFQRRAVRAAQARARRLKKAALKEQAERRKLALVAKSTHTPPHKARAAELQLPDPDHWLTDRTPLPPPTVRTIPVPLPPTRCHHCSGPILWAEAEVGEFERRCFHCGRVAA